MYDTNSGGVILPTTFFILLLHHSPSKHIHTLNQIADALTALASMFQLTPHRDFPYIEFKCHGKPALCCLIEEEQDGKLWYFDIKRYVKDKEYPKDASDNNKRM